MYCIWHFIKHNSLSTYDKLKSKYPDVLVEAEFKQGYLAYTYVKFSENLILELLNGCGEFFKEYYAFITKILMKLNGIMMIILCNR